MCCQICVHSDFDVGNMLCCMPSCRVFLFIFAQDTFLLAFANIRLVGILCIGILEPVVPFLQRLQPASNHAYTLSTAILEHNEQSGLLI